MSHKLKKVPYTQQPWRTAEKLANTQFLVSWLVLDKKIVNKLIIHRINLD